MTCPQNKRLIENRRVPMFPAASGISIADIIMWVKVEVNIMKDHRSKNKRNPRSVTVPVGSALRYNPMG